MLGHKTIPDVVPVEPTENNRPSDNLLQYVIRMSGWHQVSLCLLAILVALINLAPIELQRRIVDSAIEDRNLELLVQLGLVYLAVLVGHQSIKFVMRMYQGWVAESTIKNTRRQLLSIHGEKQESDEGSGSTVSVIGAEVEGIGTFVGENISDASANVAMLTGISAYMLYVEPQIAVFALLFFIPQIALTPFMQKLLNRLVEKRVTLVRKLGDVVSSFESGQDEPPVVRKIYFNRMQFFFVKYGMKALINLLNSLGPLTVLLYGGYLVVQGETTVGVIVAFLSGFEKMSGPMRGLINFYRIAAQINVQRAKVAEWMSERIERTNS